MDEFGHILREARETKGLTLAEVQDQIRINARFLDALECSDYDVLPTPVHVRGFLRNYARYLGLDPQPLVNRYERVLDQKPLAAPTKNDQEDVVDGLQVSPRQEQPFFNPVNFEVADGRSPNSESIIRLIIIIALVVALGLIANRFIPLLTGKGDGSEAITESITEVIQNVTDQIGGTATAEATAAATNDSSFIVSTDRNNSGEAVSPEPLPTRPILPTLEIIQLKLEITERTWMEVTIDGDVVFSGIVKQGDPPLEFEAQEEAKVNTGNAIAVFVTVNDIPWGRMGERGENHEEIWRTSQ